MLWSAARVLRTTPDVAEDVASDAFIRVFLDGSIGALKEPARLKAYLVTAARFAAIDTLRKRSREIPSEIVEEVRDSPTSFLDSAVHEENTELLSERFERVLESLRPDDKRILEMRLRGMSLGEMAEELNKTYSAVAQRFSRAMARARRNALKITD